MTAQTRLHADVRKLMDELDYLLTRDKTSHQMLDGAIPVFQLPPKLRDSLLITRAARYGLVEVGHWHRTRKVWAFSPMTGSISQRLTSELRWFSTSFCINTAAFLFPMRNWGMIHLRMTPDGQDALAVDRADDPPAQIDDYSILHTALRKKLLIDSSKTLSNFARKADVPPPAGPGKHHHKYNREEVAKILNEVLKGSNSDNVRREAQLMLDKIKTK